MKFLFPILTICAVPVLCGAAEKPLVELNFNSSTGESEIANAGSAPVVLEATPSLEFDQQGAPPNKGGKSGRFAVSGDSVNGKSPAPVELASMTISLWVCLEQAPQSPVTLIHFGTSTNDFALRLQGGTLSLRIAGKTPNREDSELEKSIAGRWYFLAVTVDTTSTKQNVRFYIGDAETDGFRAIGGPVSINFDNRKLSLKDFIIGNNPNGSGSPKGLMDNVRIHGDENGNQGALTSAELHEVMTSSDLQR